MRHLVDGVKSLLDGNPIGTPTDKINVGLFRIRTLLQSLDTILKADETTTLARLEVGPINNSFPTLDSFGSAQVLVLERPG